MSTSGLAVRPHELVLLLETKNALLRNDIQELQARYSAADGAEDHWIGKVISLHEVLRILFDAVSLPLGVLAEGHSDCGKLLEQVENEVPRLKNVVTGHETLTNMAMVLTTQLQTSKKENEDLQKYNGKLQAKMTRVESENVTLQWRLRETLELFRQELDHKTAFLDRSRVKSMDDVERMIAARINKNPVLATLEKSLDATSSPLRYTIDEMKTLRSKMTREEDDKKSYLRDLTEEICVYHHVPKNHTRISNSEREENDITISWRKEGNLTLKPAPFTVISHDVRICKTRCAIQVDDHDPIGNPFQAQDGWRVRFGTDAGRKEPASIGISFMVEKTNKDQRVSTKKKNTESLTLKWYMELKSPYLPWQSDANSRNLPQAPVDHRKIIKLCPESALLKRLWCVSLASECSSSTYRRETLKGLEDGVKACVDAIVLSEGPHQVNIWFLNPEDPNNKIDTDALSKLQQAHVERAQ